MAVVSRGGPARGSGRVGSAPGAGGAVEQAAGAPRAGAVVAAGAAAADQAAVARGPAAVAVQPAGLWAEFRAAPYAHPQIPYVALAGYQGGNPCFPRHPARANAVHYGARPDGSADSAPAINRALGEVGESGGGTVLLPPGTYRIDDVITLGWSNTTLRGAGSGATTLHATASLTDLIGPYGSRYGGDKSSWSWAGGLVWMCPADRYRALTDAIRTRLWPFEGWTGNSRDEFTELARITAETPQGGHSVSVDDPARLRPGDRVLVRYADDPGHGLLAHIAGDIEGAAAYDWSYKTKLLSYLLYEWPTRRTAPSCTGSTSRACPRTTSGPAAGWRWAPSTPTGACPSPASAPRSPSPTTAGTAATTPPALSTAPASPTGTSPSPTAGPTASASTTRRRAARPSPSPRSPPSDQIDVPDFDGPLDSRLESYGTPGGEPRNLYEAQRRLLP